jgi:hypothetical protein
MEKKRYVNYVNRIFPVFLFLLLATIITGCGSAQHKVAFQQDYTCPEGTKFAVGTVVNETGEKFDIEIEKMLADALAEELRKEDLLCKGDEKSRLTIMSKVIEYKKGNAFKRWLMPGWGGTELSIQCDLKGENNVTVGSATARRTVTAGGGYTIGAWKTIFASVAKDLVTDLREQVAKKKS